MGAILALALAAGLARASGPAPDASAFSLTVLHTNDLHGHMFPFAYTERGRSPVEQPSVGGAARRATLVRKLRREIRNPVVLVDGGDTFTRGPLTNAYEGIADVEAMNSVGYELAAVGNNEFKAKDASEREDAAGSQAALLQVVKRARFPWVCANATDGKGGFLEGVQPYVVREWNGVRVGFLGLTAPRSAMYSQTRGWTISDPITAARTWIPAARAHCDVLIGVTHLGVELDRKLAAETTGLDAIIGGDSHTFLYQAVEVRNPAGERVPIVQDGEFGVNLGRFDLRFSRAAGRWKLDDYQYRLLPVGPGLKEAEDVKRVLAPYVRPFEEVVGELDDPGETLEQRLQRTTQVMVDALRREAGADLALTPPGTPLHEVFRHRRVTRYDVYAALPFKDRVVVASLTGEQVRALLEKKPDSVVSGMARLLLPGRVYRVAFVEAMARDTYGLTDDRLQATGRDLREVVIAYLRRGAAAAGMTAAVDQGGAGGVLACPSCCSEAR